jgi:hypothetical protein
MRVSFNWKTKNKQGFMIYYTRETVVYIIITKKKKKLSIIIIYIWPPHCNGLTNVSGGHDECSLIYYILYFIVLPGKVNSSMRFAFL